MFLILIGLDFSFRRWIGNPLSRSLVGLESYTYRPLVSGIYNDDIPRSYGLCSFMFVYMDSISFIYVKVLVRTSA